MRVSHYALQDCWLLNWSYARVSNSFYDRYSLKPKMKDVDNVWAVQGLPHHEKSKPSSCSYSLDGICKDSNVFQIFMSAARSARISILQPSLKLSSEFIAPETYAGATQGYPCFSQNNGGPPASCSGSFSRHCTWCLVLPALWPAWTQSMFIIYILEFCILVNLNTGSDR